MATLKKRKFLISQELEKMEFSQNSKVFDSTILIGFSFNESDSSNDKHLLIKINAVEKIKGGYRFHIDPIEVLDFEERETITLVLFEISTNNSYSEEGGGTCQLLYGKHLLKKEAKYMVA